MSMNDAEYACTELEDIPKIVEELRRNFYETMPTSRDYRLKQLGQLKALLEENREEIYEEYTKYFGGFSNKHYLTRFYLIEVDVIDAMNNLDCYLATKEKHPQKFPMNIMWSSEVKPHPRGVVCIIGAWNYPISLLLRPLVGAIAAGNAVLVKPSEVTDGFARLLLKLIPKYLDTKMIKVVTGGRDETTVLLKQKFDFICFTGGSQIGRIVMQAAAQHLTPVCLELGGKNPVIIDDNANLDTSMKRIAHARWWFNSGQVCVCPEYLLVSKNKVNECINHLRKHINNFFIDGAGNKLLSDSEHYGKIVNTRHWRRLDQIRQHYIKNEPEKIAIGETLEKDKNFGISNEKDRFMAPMVLYNVNFDNDEIMKQEVFGPFLTIIGMDGTSNEWKSKACDMIRSGGEPLVCYIYSSNNSFIKYFDNRISAGSITCNDCIFQMSLKEVPFGGTGESGMGHYGGKHSFDTFSHYKPLNLRSHGLEFLNNDRYANTGGDLNKIKGMMEKLKPNVGGSWFGVLKYILIIFVGIIVGYYLSLRVNA